MIPKEDDRVSCPNRSTRMTDFNPAHAPVKKPKKAKARVKCGKVDKKGEAKASAPMAKRKELKAIGR